ncbi:uncharacterized protein LOC113464400 isoform X2 [Ceratina calcarata]|uniref:Uncharacterized protein LOC113464400 isoform X2 n=1 Tax=Ceratina calcarata TaxID=156304 RepID=A0AAJ7S1R5_9HYME|nr:uncharacterized protein LOC113464400 isoform X2 [Ceratina calcarata]
MPTQKELRATMSKKLQEAIKHPDPTVAAGRKSAIKRWVGVLQDNFMGHIKYFKDDKLKFLHEVFQDGDCWSEELFSELEKTILPPGGDGPCSNLRSRSKAHGSKKTTLPVDDSPQSELGTPSVVEIEIQGT